MRSSLGAIVMWLMCGCLFSPAVAAASSVDEPIVGSWLGTLDAGVKLRIVFHIERSADGKFSTTLDSPDQGAKGIRVDETTFADNSLRLTIKSLSGSFEGKLADGEINGKWTQAGASLPLLLKRTEKVPDLVRPQMPKKPYPYAEREVTYRDEQANVTIAGTLTLPKTDKPCAAVLLITGSGAQDRDESLLGHKPFLVLADDLTRRGIAVLRVDDRGVGSSTGDPSASTTSDLADDVLAGVAFLKTCPEIDPQRIGLLGHSEGGLIAPLAASRSSDVKFIVLIAGPGVTGEEILYAQGELITRAAGAGEAAVKHQRALQEKMFAIAKEYDKQVAAAPQDMPPDPKEAEKQIVALLTGLASFLPEEQRKEAEAKALAQARPVLTPWFRYFLIYDPRPALAKVTCPVLAVIGERDLQVPPAQNFPELEKALKTAGNTDYTLRELPDLNHLLQTCKTGSPAEYAEIEETIAPAALDLIGNWIVQKTAR